MREKGLSWAQPLPLPPTGASSPLALVPDTSLSHTSVERLYPVFLPDKLQRPGSASNLSWLPSPLAYPAGPGHQTERWKPCQAGSGRGKTPTLAWGPLLKPTVPPYTPSNRQGQSPKREAHSWLSTTALSMAWEEDSHGLGPQGTFRNSG